MDEQENAFNWNEFGQRTWVVVITGLVFAPVGIFLAWRKSDWTPKAKWIATGLMGLLFYGQFLNKPNADVDNTSRGEVVTAPSGEAVSTPSKKATKPPKALTADARSYAELERQFRRIMAKADLIKSAGDEKGALTLVMKGKPIGLKAIEIRNKYKEHEADFNAAVEKAEPLVAAADKESNAGMKTLTAVELVELASNGARASKELPSRFRVTGIIVEVDDESGVFGGKTYTVKLRGTIRRGYVNTWVECKMADAGGLERLGKGSYAEIEGQYDRTLSEIVFLTKCSLNKAFHEQ